MNFAHLRTKALLYKKVFMKSPGVIQAISSYNGGSVIHTPMENQSAWTNDA